MDGVQIWIFDQFEQAAQARQALLDAGFHPDELSLRLPDDEAGPVAGNFTVGNMPTESDRHTYERNYAAVHHGAQCVLTLALAHQARAETARAILAGCGGRGGNGAVP